MADFLDMFLAAQQARRNEQQYRLAEMQRQEFERQQMDQRSLQMARQQAAQGDLEELRVRAPEEAAGIDRQRQLAGLRKAAATQDPAALEALAAFDPKDPWLEAVQRAQISERDQRLAGEKVARDKEQQLFDRQMELRKVAAAEKNAGKPGVVVNTGSSTPEGARMELPTGAKSEIIDKLQGARETVFQIGELKRLGDMSGVLGLANRAQNWVKAGVAGAAPGALSDKSRATLEKARTFQEITGNIFNAMRKVVTGAGASVNELRMLEDTIVNPNIDPVSYKSSVERLERFAQRAVKVNAELLRKGIDISDPNYGAAFDASMGYRGKGMDLKEAAKGLIRQGMTPEQAAQALSGSR